MAFASAAICNLVHGLRIRIPADDRQKAAFDGDGHTVTAGILVTQRQPCSAWQVRPDDGMSTPEIPAHIRHVHRATATF
jgi:hypothetical protein